jgi:hypothetical protein
MKTLWDKIADHEERLGLISLEVRESVGGWQAIAKYRAAPKGPWGVGCSEDMATALDQALDAGDTACVFTIRDEIEDLLG